MICCYIEIIGAFVKDNKKLSSYNNHDIFQENLMDTYFMFAIVINVMLLAIFILYPYA